MFHVNDATGVALQEPPYIVDTMFSKSRVA
ncbi:hypothetical protein MYFR107205_03175 [Mycolicibacterium frederiksbergense]